MNRRAIALLFACSLLLAQEGGDPATSQVPAQSAVVVRLPSLDRVDAASPEILPFIGAFLDEKHRKMFAEMPVSRHLVQESGLDEAAWDRTRPFYLCLIGRDDGLLLLPAAADAAWEGEKALTHGNVAILRDGVIRAGEADQVGVEGRGTPTELLPGDLSLHVYLGEVVGRNKERIDGFFARMQAMSGMLPLPAAFSKLPGLSIAAAQECVNGVESFDYAFTWKGGSLHSEGLLRTRAGTPLNAFFSRVGTPGDNDLVGFLPTNAFMVADFVGDPTWPVQEMMAFLDKGLGEGVGRALLGTEGGIEVWSQATGRRAVAVSVGAFMAASTTSVTELKEENQVAALLKAHDVAPLNQSLKDAGLPIVIRFEPSVAKHGETELHRVAVASEDPSLAMMAAMSQSYLAVEGRYLLGVQSLNAEAELKALIDRVRKGERVDHPHAAAMGRLGRKHNVGFTVNLGAPKQMLLMLAPMIEMQQPGASKVLGAIPDSMPMSTAITFQNGEASWRGDWPAKEIAAIAQAATALPKP
ncbi:MAG: hypothetical protein ACREID_04655, partial [Planctomycetota bacterium]